VKFGQGVGMMGLEHGGIQIDRVGDLETMAACRDRIKTNLGVTRVPVCYSPRTLLFSVRRPLRALTAARGGFTS
jgi:hypothetical protein